MHQNTHQIKHSFLHAIAAVLRRRELPSSRRPTRVERRQGSQHPTKVITARLDTRLVRARAAVAAARETREARVHRRRTLLVDNTASSTSTR